MKTFATFAAFCSICLGSAFAQIRETPGPSTEFIAYTGAQNLMMEVNPEFVPGFAVPIYFGRPDRPVIIIGHVIVHHPPEKPAPTRSEVMRAAAVAAKLHGAQAIILLLLPEQDPEIFMAAVAIKWR